MSEPSLTNRSKVAAESARSMSVSLRAIAPLLVDYGCELSELIGSVEADSACTRAFIHYANLRKEDNDSSIDSVRHAIVYLGLIDSKHFLFSYLLVQRRSLPRGDLVRLLVRARMTSLLFKTNGPINKDLAFIAGLLTNHKKLAITVPSQIFSLFKLESERSGALKHFDYGLRDTIKQVVFIETRLNPKSPHAGAVMADEDQLYRDALRWANHVVNAL